MSPSMQLDVAEALPRDREQLRVEIEPAHLVPRAQLLEMLAGATRHVEQGRGAGRALLDQRVKSLPTRPRSP